MSKARDTLVIILFSYLIFLFFIGAVEILLRTTHIFGATISCSEPDTLIGWKNTPNCRFRFEKENDHPIQVKYNNHGYRDIDRSLVKPPDTYRIAILGDSFTEALQVELERTFIALTERRLNNSMNTQVELMNFGRSGSTQTEEYLTLTNDVMRFSPDMVLLFFFPGNDIKEVHRKTNNNSSRPYYKISEHGELVLDTSFADSRTFKIKSFIHPFKQHSALISFLSQRYNAYQKQKRANPIKKIADKGTEVSSEKLDTYLTLATNNPDKTYLNNYQLNKMLIQAMSEYCQENRIRFMLVTLDNEAYIKEIDEKFKSIDSTFNSNYFEDGLNDFSKSLNIEYLGLQRVFEQFHDDTGTALHWGHWGHWNYEGHKVVADALTRKLEKLFIQINQ